MDRLSGYVRRAIAEGGSGNAEIVRETEGRLADFVGTAHALCTSSGTTALMCALRAVGVRPGARVAVSALGPAMTGLAIAALGAVPVFVDSRSPRSFGLDPDATRAAVRAGVAAVVTVPMWGYWDEDAALLAAVRTAGVAVVVDAAQAPFLRLRGGLGAVADAVCLSLHGRKPIRSGEGGVCLTDDPGVAERVLTARNFGQRATLAAGRVDPTGAFGARFGANAKINALGAAWVLAQLDDIDELRDRQRGLRALARDAFAAAGLAWHEASQGDDVDEHGRYGLVGLCPGPAEAARMARALADAGTDVDTLRYGYAPMYRAPHLARYAASCPNAERLAATAVACRLEEFAPGSVTS